MKNQPPSRLLIFDVDGTILLNGPVVKDSFFYAFKQACGVEPGRENIGFMGMTDRGIFRILFDRSGVKGDFDDLFRKFAGEFNAYLREVYPGDPNPYLLAGVAELLAALHERDDVALALGTGNIEKNCRIKLGRFGLNEYFPVGGFGDHFENRADLIGAALNKAKAYYNWSGNPDNAWVIGDTPHDVNAGKANGTRVLAVASGLADKEILLETDADVVLNDFSDTQQVFQALEL